jgi:hypothetical protein
LKLAELVSAAKIIVETASLSALIAERDALAASRRVHELDNHHNALACGYCSGPLKDELLRLQAEVERQAGEVERLGEVISHQALIMSKRSRNYWLGPQ